MNLLELWNYLFFYFSCFQIRKPRYLKLSGNNNNDNYNHFNHNDDDENDDDNIYINYTCA